MSLSNQDSASSTSYLAQLRSIVSNVPHGIITFTDDYEVDIINGTAVELLGFPDSTTPFDLVDGSYKDVLIKNIDVLTTFEKEIIQNKERGFALNSVLNRGYILNFKCQAMLHGVLLLIENVTSEVSLLNDLEYKRCHDSLTNLTSRDEFEIRVDRFLDKIQLIPSSQGALVFMDLDRFKPINDIAGHHAGDAVLINIASILTNRVRSRDTVARIGGDEFGLLFEDCSIDVVQKIMAEILATIESSSFLFENRVFSLTSSAGIVLASIDFKDASELINAADVACHTAKSSGKNRISVVSHGEQELIYHSQQISWLERIDNALKEHRFIPYVQRMAAINQANEAHYEVLIRLEDEYGFALPGEFLPTAERYDFMPQIDRWMIDKVFSLSTNSLHIFSINLSGQTISDDSLLTFIDECQQKYSVKSQNIIFEITETSVINSLLRANELIQNLRSRGFKFALDDFGVGLASFDYLKNLEFDFVKIDGSFVREIVSNPISSAIVKAINDVAHVAKHKTIAEFVENETILEKLADIGVDFVQGYHIHKPQSFDSL